MLNNLSIWKWLLLSIGIVQASHQPSLTNHYHHESPHFLTTFPSPASLLSQRNKSSTVSQPPKSLAISPPTPLPSKSISSSQSPLLFSIQKSPAKLKHITSNDSVMIASFQANLTRHDSLKHHIQSGKILNFSENHYFVQNFSCENVQLTGARGSIFNPGYPLSYSNGTSCSWTLNAKPHEIITISFNDLDVPESPSKLCNLSNSDESCCQTSAVIIQTIDNKTISDRRFCGRSRDNRDIFQTYIIEGESVQIFFKGFHSKNKTEGRGFHATFSKTWIGKPCLQESEYKCSNGKCIDKSWVCNRRDECGDNSDEVNCDHVCRESNEAQCLNEGSHTPSCYSFPKHRCDGNWNCANGTDERGCDKCPHGMFVCSSGLICYSERARCNGNWDCSDFKDELNCGLCGPEEISCGLANMKACFNPFIQRCNGVFDCPNGIDEMGCEKQHCSKKILCANNAKCFVPDERCNGISDCSDGSDEKNCTKDLCRPDHGAFLCSNGQCIQSVQVCDTAIDCEDGSDEINCTNELCRPEKGNFLCANGNCIQAILTCDRSNDCGDSSDEINCLKNSLVTAALMGSLICGLLLVIAISCTCKLIALRQIEQQRQARGDFSCGTSINNLYSSSHIYPRYFPFTRSNTHSTSPLFSPDSEYFYREPPPSYASAVSGIDEYGASCGSSSSSSRRRPRRLRPRSRRRPPTPPPLQQSPSESDSIINNGSSNNNNNMINSTSNVLQRPSTCSTITTSASTLDIFPITSTAISMSSNLGSTIITETTVAHHQQSSHPSGGDRRLNCSSTNSYQHSCYKNDDEDVSSQSHEIGQAAPSTPAGRGGSSCADDSNESIQEPYHHNSSTSSTVTIELNNILPSSHSSSLLDCDQQPLLSG